jgi:hypothetical protein
MLSPLTAMAEPFATPGTLLSAIQGSGTPRAFTLEAHGQKMGTYFSVWANGTQQGAVDSSIDPDSQLSGRATVDIAFGEMKIRIKGEVMIMNSMLYAKVGSVTGNFSSDIATMTVNIVQKKWIALPLDASEFRDSNGTPAFSPLYTDPATAESIYTMTSSSANGIDTYNLKLTQDAAVSLAQQIRNEFNDPEPVSTDFFPWRDLAEGIRFDWKVMTRGYTFVSSTMDLSMSNKHSSLTVHATEKASSPLRLTVPANTVTIDELWGSFDFPVDMMDEPMNNEETNLMWQEIPEEPENVMPVFDENPELPVSDDWWNFPDPRCTDPETPSAELVQLQRTGECPAVKVPTRYTR